MTPELAEVWCEKCPEPAVREVETQTEKHALCERHADMLEFQLRSTNFNGGKRR